MGSMNNWLAFSLSPQQVQNDDEVEEEDQNNTVSRRLGFNSDQISENNHPSFHLSSSHPTPFSMNHLQSPTPFDTFEASFNTNHQHHSYDWNIKCGGGADQSRNSSSMLMGETCSHEYQEPKLENFLGGHSFGDHEHSKLAAPISYNAHHPLQQQQQQLDPYSTTSHLDNINKDNNDNNINGGGVIRGSSPTGMSLMNNNNSNRSSSSIGLSMIKTWLRNQPAPTQQLHHLPLAPQPEGAEGVVTSQTLSLSMSSGGESCSSDNKQQQKVAALATLDSQTGAIEAALPNTRKSIDTFGQRTSIYRGVTRHRWTGRYEAHLWDNSCRREGQTRKGRQVYLGGYDKEEKAARAYDLAALKYWGPTTTTNFSIVDYEKELEEMKHMTRQEFVASLRRKSSGFSRGASIYRGVTRHHQHGRWQARIGRVAGNKDLYLGTFSTQEEAAEAYDIAAIKFRGLNAVTNFEINKYDVKSILESSTLPIGGAAKRLKDVEHADLTVEGQRTDFNMNTQLSDVSNYGWPRIAAAYPQPQAAPAVFGMHHPYGQRFWCKQEQDVDNTGNYTFQDLQPGNTHNFFHPAAVQQNYMSMVSSPMEHNSSSGSVVYGTGSGDHAQGNIGYANVLPISSINVASDGNRNQGNGYGDGEVKAMGYDSMYGSMDSYQARNLYYLSHQQSSSAGVIKASLYDESACNTWVPTAVPAALASATTANSAFVHETPSFTVWNDTGMN